MSPELQARLDAHKAKLAAMTPEERCLYETAQAVAQQESWIRAFGPCEHGDYDWETCPDCLTRYAPHNGTSRTIPRRASEDPPHMDRETRFDDTQSIL